jgi:hypothetical protein
MEAGYPDWLGSSGKFVENSAKIICLQITDRVQYSGLASRTLNQVWLEGLDAGFILSIVTAELQTANINC